MLGYVLVIWAGRRIGERWWLTTWALYLPPLLFLTPCLIATLLALLRRRWRAFGGQMVVTALGVALLCQGAYRWPPAPGRGELRVMTWNVMELKGNPDGVVATIRREMPDVLLLQEVRQQPRTDPVAWLASRLPGWQSVRGADVAILSPHPLGPATAYSLGVRSSSRRALRAPIRIGARSVECLVAHFSTADRQSAREAAWQHPRAQMEVSAAVRAEQTTRLTSLLSGIPRPLIVGGDFNSPPDSILDRAMTARLSSTFNAGGLGFGWSYPARLPLLRIDHVYVSADLRVRNCRVLPTLASDHRPMVIDLDWR